MAMKFMASPLHPSEEALRQDGKPLLLGGGCRHLAPYRGDHLFRGHRAGISEVDPLQGGDVAARGGRGWGQKLECRSFSENVVAAMISGISRTLQPGEEGGGDWVGAGCGQLPPHPLAMVSLTTKYQYCSSSRLTPANSTRKSGAPNKNTPPGGQTIITF